MTKIIVIGHGNFGTGLVSGAKLITGEHPFITAIDFVDGMSSNDLSEKVAKVLQSLPKDEEIYCFTDLAGGTPFNVCGSYLKDGHLIQLFAGSNLPMIIETSIKITYDMPLVPDEIRKVGIENIQTDLSKKKTVEIDTDGI